MKKKILLIALACLVMGLSLNGCSKTKESKETTENTNTADEANTASDNKDNNDEKKPLEDKKEDAIKEENRIEAMSGVYQHTYTEEIEGETGTYYNYLILNDDGSGQWLIQDTIPITWRDSEIECNGNVYKFDYDSDDCEITLHDEFGEEFYNFLYGVDTKEFTENFSNPEYMWGFENNFFSSFVEEHSGKYEFDSYDELISYLEAGEGYAYIEVVGYNGKVLAITEELIATEGKYVSNSVYFYALINNKVKYVGIAFTYGEGNTVRMADNIIYVGEPDQVESDFFNETGDGIMIKDLVYKYENEDGSISYGGFTRENNSFDEDGFTEVETQEPFFECLEIYENAESIEFTLVK